MAVGVKLVLAGLLSVLLLGGVYEHIFNLEPNKCRMTYMYEHPHFIPLDLPTEIKERFPHYSLIVYGEGEYAQSLKKGNMSGVPVLFIPGNGGSYKQVRSLASVAYRRAMDQESNFHFNFFAVNLNEELGALYGPVLEKQTEFVIFAIQQILKQYEGSKKPPTSVIVVGHSMGGMVARAALASHNITTSMVPLIITQGTPHTRPVIITDAAIEQFYDKVNSYWAMERMFDLKSVVLVSVGGGRNDIQVSTAHTNTPFADIATTTNSVPTCWLTADHQAIVWCHQLVMPTVRALFDIVDRKTHQITVDQDHIINVFDFHLSKRITGKKYKPSPYLPLIEMDKEADWREILKRQYSYSAKQNARNTYLMIPVFPEHPYYHEATIIATNLDKKDWIMACTVNHVHKNIKMCLEAENFSVLTQKMPGKVKTVGLSLRSIADMGYSHLIINLPPTNEKVDVSIDVHSEDGRHRAIEVPVFLRSFTQTLVIDTTPQGALSYNVTLLGHQEMWQSIKLTVKSRSAACASYSTSLARVYTPWLEKESFVHSSGSVKTFGVELDTPPPPGDNSSTSIKFFLDPDCTYNIVIQGSLVGVFRRIVLLYGQQIPTYIAVQLLLTLANQLKTLGEEGSCPSFFSAMLTLTPLAVVPFVKLSNFMLKALGVTDDFTIMADNGETLGLLPILMFLGSLPLSLAIGGVMWVLVLFCGNGAHSLVTKVLGRSLGGGDMVAELAVSGLSRIPVVICVALISLAYSTCGTLALSLAGFLYFVKVFKLYEDLIEKLVLGLLPGASGESAHKALGTVHFHLTLMIITSLIAALNAPALIVWGKLVRHDVQLAEDPSFLLAASVLSSLSLLWQKKIPRTNIQKKYFKQLSHAIHFLAVVTLLFGSIHLYRVSYILMIALMLVGAHQQLAPTRSSETDDQDTPSETSRPSMARVDEVVSDSTNTRSDNPENEDTSQSD